MPELFRPYPVLKSVIVNLKTGTAFRGVVWRQTGGYMVLRNAVVLHRNKESQSVDGEVVVNRSEIEFIQVL